MKYKNLAVIGLNFVVIIFLIFFLEGIISVWNRGNPRPSLLYRAYTKALRLGVLPSSLLHKKPHLKNLKKVVEVELNNDFYLADEQQIIDRRNDFLSSHLIFDNMFGRRNDVPDYMRASYEDPIAGLMLKPNLSKECGQFKTLIFYGYDPLVYSANIGEVRYLRQQHFIDKYVFYKTYYHTDKNSDRVTIPKVDAKKFVLVIGDSVGFGLGLNDDETLSSLLQQKDRRVRYVNCCVPGAKAEDNIKRLRLKLQIYGSRIVGVIYVHCENDFSSIATPEYIATKLSEMLASHRIKYKIIIYQQYIYRTMPDIIKKNIDDLIKMNDRKVRMLAILAKNGFHVIDFYDLVKQYRIEKGSLFAGFALYIDHCHFSREATRILADKIPPLGKLP